jgi:hypothetical protein
VSDPNADLIRAALEGIARVDPELRGAHVKSWYVIGEFEREGDGTTLSIFRSSDSAVWNSLGHLEFARTVEKERVLERERERGTDDEGPE